MRRGNLPRARRRAAAALSIAADDAALHALAGRIEREAGDLPAALAAYDRAVELAPDEPRYLFDRGWVHHLRGDAGAARRDFEAVLALDPTHADAWLLRALSNRDWRRMHADLVTALAVASPRWPGAEQVLVHLSILRDRHDLEPRSDADWRPYRENLAALLAARRIGAVQALLRVLEAEVISWSPDRASSRSG